MGELILIAALAVTATGWFFYLRARSKAGKAGNWPMADGVVTVSEVVHKVETSSDNSSQDVYYVQPTYTYEVGGKDLTGTRLSFGAANRFDDRQKAEEIVARYPVGARVQVHYNPDKPDECTLETTLPSLVSPLIATLAGAVIAYVGVGFI